MFGSLFIWRLVFKMIRPVSNFISSNFVFIGTCAAAGSLYFIQRDIYQTSKNHPLDALATVLALRMFYSSLRLGNQVETCRASILTALLYAGAGVLVKNGGSALGAHPSLIYISAVSASIAGFYLLGFGCFFGEQSAGETVYVNNVNAPPDVKGLVGETIVRDVFRKVNGSAEIVKEMIDRGMTVEINGRHEKILGNDMGADVLTFEYCYKTKRQLKVLIQVKNFKGQLGNEDILKTVGAKEFYKADRAVVVCFGGFNRNAVQAAMGTNIELIDFQKLDLIARGVGIRIDQVGAA